MTFPKFNQMGYKNSIFPLLIILIIGFTAVSRLVFIQQNELSLIWDSAKYWGETIQTRNTFCEIGSYCEPITLNYEVKGDVLDHILLDRSGINFIIFGLIMTVVDASTNTIYLIHTLMDMLVCLAIIDTVFRISKNRILSLLAGLVFALYIPTIISSGSYLQQPMLRFYLAMFIWTVARSLTTSSYRVAIFAVIVASFCAILFGFTSLTTRPVMWLMMLTMTLLLYRHATLSKIYQVSLMIIGLTFIGLLMIGTSVSNLEQYQEKRDDIISTMLIGLSSSGKIEDLTTTVRSSPDFWLPTAYADYDYNRSKSIVTDFLENPLEFTYLWLYSIYANWQYPDYIYLHEFILTLRQQQIQHYVIMSLAIIGLFRTIDSQLKHPQLYILLVCLTAIITAVYSVISVEPRRLIILIPIVSIYAAYGLYTVYEMVERKLLFRKWTLIIISMTVIAWLVPISWFLIVIRIDPLYLHYGLVVVRLSLLIITLMLMIRTFKLHYSSYLILVAVILPISMGQIQFSEWSGWTASVDSEITITIDDFPLSDELFYWLIVDVEDTTSANAMSIYINDELLKSPEDEMEIWEAGIPAYWKPYNQLRQHSNANPARDMWFAYFVPKSYLPSDNISITIIPDHALSIRGDYISDSIPANHYWGPGLDPWIEDQSFWKYQWNATDPRIWSNQVIHGNYMTGLDGDLTLAEDDLSPDMGIQSGRFRVYLVTTPFSNQTNALSNQNPSHKRQCQFNETYMLMVCSRDDGTIEYQINETTIATASAETMLQPYDSTLSI